MDPNDIIIPEPMLDGAAPEIIEVIVMCEDLLAQVHPHLSDLAEAYKAIPDENVDEKQAALDAYSALDAKRIELDDVLAAHNKKLMELNGGDL